MKRVMLAGNTACGKTTLCQALAGQPLSYKKTQSVELVAQAIDTPGEYLENRGMYKALIVTAVEADYVLFVQDATDERFRYSPQQASGFCQPVVGVVTKADLATPKQLTQARELLELAGAAPVFVVSAYTQQGMEALCQFLKE